MRPTIETSACITYSAQESSKVRSMNATVSKGDIVSTFWTVVKLCDNKREKSALVVPTWN